MEIKKENYQKKNEMMIFLDTQKDLQKKIEKWNKQKGKLGRLIKECKFIVVKSRKLMKKVKKSIPVNKNRNYKESQTIDNFYHSHVDHELSQKNEKDSDISQSDNQSETRSNKIKNITRSQRGERPSKKIDDNDWENDKMYHSTRPDKNRDQNDDEFLDQRSDKMISMSIRRFKKEKVSKQMTKNSKYFENDYSMSGNNIFIYI